MMTLYGSLVNTTRKQENLSIKFRRTPFPSPRGKALSLEWKRMGWKPFSQICQPKRVSPFSDFMPAIQVAGIPLEILFNRTAVMNAVHLRLMRVLDGMPSRTIRVSDDVYRLLLRLRRPGESLSQTIRRLVGRGRLSECAGLWSDMSKEEIDEIMDNIRLLRRRVTEDLGRSWECEGS